MKLRWPLLVAAVVIAGALLVGGRDSGGRLALSLRLPGLAAAFFGDPGWRGVARYRGDAFEQAAQAFDAAGSAAAFNRGNAFARAGDYARALIAYDEVLARDPAHAAAQANFALVASIYAGTGFDGVPIPMELKKRIGDVVAAEIGQGGGRASGTGSEVTNTGAGFAGAELESSGLRRVPRIFDEKYINASDRWLDTLQDQPAIYLRARLAAERKRRIAAGEISQ